MHYKDWLDKVKGGELFYAFQSGSQARQAIQT
jgi:hypothetical protein